MKRLWIFLMGMALFASCTKNNDSTIVLVGDESYIDDILSVVSDTVFWHDFGNINEGTFPPDIQGTYLVDPKLRIGTNVENIPTQIVEPSVKLRFTKQHNGIMVMEMLDGTETVTDTVFVMGNASKFTIYFTEDKHFELPFENVVYHMKLRRGIVMTGRKTTEGLADFRMATIVMNMEDNSGGLMEQYPVGSYFIYKDGDGLASNTEW